MLISLIYTSHIPKCPLHQHIFGAPPLSIGSEASLLFLRHSNPFLVGLAANVGKFARSKVVQDQSVFGLRVFFDPLELYSGDTLFFPYWTESFSGFCPYPSFCCFSICSSRYGIGLYIAMFESPFYQLISSLISLL